MKLTSKLFQVGIQISIAMLSLQSFAGREDFNKPSREMQEAIATAATSLGYDLSSKDGRKQFGDYMKTQRDSLATSLGIDMSTKEGRKKYHETVKSHVDEVATTQGFDLKTKEGRDSLEKYLIANGEYAYVRPARDEKRGPKQEGEKQKPEKNDQAENVKQDGARHAHNAEQSDQQRPPKHECASGEQQAAGGAQMDRRPPPPREQRQNDQAKGASQEQRPEQKQ